MNNILKKPYITQADVYGIVWVENCLKSGVSFANLVQSNLDITSGNLSIAVITKEQEQAIEKQKSLEWATVENYSPDALEVKETMLLDALRELEKDQGPLAVISIDDVRDITIKRYQYPDLPYFKYNNLYMYYQSISEAYEIKEFKALEMTTGYCNNEFIVPLKALPIKETLTQNDAHKLALSVIGVISGAYHGETFTIWNKGK